MYLYCFFTNEPTNCKVESACRNKRNVYSGFIYTLVIQSPLAVSPSLDLLCPLSIPPFSNAAHSLYLYTQRESLCSKNTTLIADILIQAVRDIHRYMHR